MELSQRRFPTFGFLFALFCFFLPFVTLSCPGGSVSFTGMQLAAGTTIPEPQMFGQATERKIPAEPLAAFALLCALGGLVVTLARGRLSRLGAGVAATLGAAFLLLLRGKIGRDVLEEGNGMFQLSYGAGFWLAILTLATAAGISFAVSKARENPPLRAAEAAGGANPTLREET